MDKIFYLHISARYLNIDTISMTLGSVKIKIFSELKKKHNTKGRGKCSFKYENSLSSLT